MTARNYDIIITVDDASSFATSNFIVGNTSITVGVLADIDVANNILKVKLANTLQEFSSSEVIHSNTITISGTANGAINSDSLPFQANVMSGNTTTAIATISSISPSPFIAEKNAFTQAPLVRLYSIYYPGEWYPPNENGNPTQQGEGRAWPSAFPLRFAEIIGDTHNDLAYNVTYGGTSFMPYPVNLDSFDQGTDGRINDLSVTLFNVDNIISTLVEDPYLVGNNTSNSVVAYVNNEYVHGIDPRTVNADPIDVGSIGEEAFDSLTRARANGLAYSSTVAGSYGMDNASFSYADTNTVNGTWQEQKMDTRDLLGGVVEIKTTFASFLDVWPEYSLVTEVNSNVINVTSALPYRIGDNVKSSAGSTEGTIQNIYNNETIYLTNSLDAGTSVSDAIYVINSDADTESYHSDNFKINQLEGLNDHVATFSLVSWLQYFKMMTPRRKYYKNTCQWRYKGAECQYPGAGGLAIPGTTKLSNVNFLAANNEIALDEVGDVCPKSFTGCSLRGNEVHFGGFIGTSRTIPRQ